MHRGGLLLFLLLGLIGLTLAVLLLLPEDALIIGVEKDDFGNLAYLAMIALMIAASFRLRGTSVSKQARDIAIWLVLGLVLVAGYTLKDDLFPLWQRVKSALVPGLPVNLPDKRVHVARSRTGEFAIKASVNGTAVGFIFDTGASSVVLTYDDARKSGFQPERLTFGIPVRTANGQTAAAPITIGRIAVGSIVRENVPGLVANRDDLHASLLGMSFMRELQGFSVDGDTLELRD